jgi:hypothetical protein
MRKLIGFAGCFLVVFLLGILVGIAIDVKQRTNIVRMAVQYDSHEVFVAPFVGDTVEWFQVLKDGTFAQVDADFGSDPSMSPCDPTFNDKPNCHIRKPNNYSDRYYYTCKAPYTCIDPGGGPQSGTRMSYMSADGPQFWSVVSYDLKGVFNLPQESVVVPHVGAPGISPKSIAGSPAHVRVSCPGGTLTVSGPDPTTNPYNPNGQIIWITNLSQLTITDNSGLCSGDTSNLAQTGCNINGATGNYTYIVSSTDTTCTTGSPSTQNVAVKP